MGVLFYYLCGVSLVSFLMMGFDKYLARNHKRRISENSLLFWAVLGGSIGTVIGIGLFNHKSSKRSFQWKLWGILIIQFVLIYIRFQIFKSEPNVFNNICY